MPTPTQVTSQIIDPQSETVDELERAIEGAVVHIQGPETVTGLKTFTQAVTAPEFIGNVRGGIVDGVLLGNLDLNGFQLIGFTGTDFLLRTESSAPGRSILAVNTPDFNSYLKVTDLGAAVLESPAQVLIDIGAEPSLGNPSSSGFVLSSTVAGVRSWVAQSGGGGGSVATDTIWDEKGDLAAGTGADTAIKLTVGANDTILIADSTQATGIRWGTPASIRTALGLVIGTNVQAFDADLASWASVTRASGFDTFAATPTSTNLRNLVTGDTGTGGLFFSNGNIGIATGTSLTLTGNIEALNLHANSSTFDLVNTTATTVNFAGAATALNMGSAASGITTINSPTVSFAGTLLQSVTSYNTNIGSLSKKFLALHAAELWVETLVAQDTMATIGGRILVGPTTALIADVAAAATTIDVKHNNLASGDRVYMESSGKVEFMAVTSAPTTITGGFRYSVTRNLDGTGANDWFAGDAVFNTGTTGNGFIDLYSLRGVKASSEAGPTIVGNVRNSATYNDWSARWAVGNLKGLYDYGTTTFGAAFGQKAAGQTWVAVDATNGFRVMNNTTTFGQWNTSGVITIGETGANKSYLTIDSADGLRMFSNATVVGQWDTNGDFILGESTVGLSNLRYNKLNNRFEWRSGSTVKGFIDQNAAFDINAGQVKLSASVGLKFDNVIGAGSGNLIQFVDSTAGTTTFNGIKVGTDIWRTRLESSLDSDSSTGYSDISLSNVGNGGAPWVLFNLRATGSAYASHPGKAMAEIFSQGSSLFEGLVIGADAWPTHMLTVYGTGWFESTLTVAGSTSLQGLTVAGASAASTPAQIWTGAWFTGGTGTTTMPHLLIRATGTTAATTWSTAGTAFGINAVTGFTGNFLDFKLAGASASAFKVSATGAVLIMPGADEAVLIGGTSGTSHYFRMAESAGNNWQGGYLQQSGAANTFVIGVHATGDLLVASDIPVMTMFRATGMLQFSGVGNIKIAGTAVRATTEGTNHLDIFDGTAPVGTLANGVSLYSTAGELRVMDAAGNATLLSPHDKKTNEWIYFSKNTVTGKVLRIDMERFMRQHGSDFIHEYSEAA